MNCKRLIKKDGVVIEDITVRESEELKGFIEIENEKGQVNLIFKEEIATIIKNTDSEDFVCQTI